MASISKFNTALCSLTSEWTVAAANFNLDFSLMKVEAPKEFHGVRDALSRNRRDEAEEGQPHITARKLGALFEAIIPQIPNLIQAYGNRASSISSRVEDDKQNRLNTGLFTAQAGIDGTSIWAAATSGRGALAVHLLACMLARMWKSYEAISIWAELVDRRKQDIVDTYNNDNAIETAAIMAAKQTFSREQLAQWDSSARSWLQTADTDRRIQQTQLMLVVNNVRLPVNSIKDPYPSVIKAWKSAMSAMEQLVRGVPQQVQDGAVLLAMSSWHLYPNMEILADSIKHIDQHDDLMNNGLITISAYGANHAREGVFWSLPLSRMRFYSPPVLAERQISSETSRITMSEFWIVILGIVISQWNTVCTDISKCCSFIIFLSDLVNKPDVSVSWLKYLGDAAVRYSTAVGVDRAQSEKLLGLGMRQCQSFLNDPDLQPPSLFGLTSFPILLGMVAELEDQLEIMRKVARSLQVPDQELMIKYRDDRQSYRHRYGLTSALTESRPPRDNEDPPLKRKRHSDEETGHRLWLPVNFTSHEEICNEYGCSCSSVDGPECSCAEDRSACTLKCHPTFETLSQCDTKRKFIDSQVCASSRQEGCACSVCALRRSISKFETLGGRWCLLHHHDLRTTDDWHFMLGDAEYAFVLGDPKGTSLFKREECQVRRYSGSTSGSPASIDEIKWILASNSVKISKVRSYLDDWWHKGPVSFDSSAARQSSSFKGLVFATELYNSLKGSTINIEVVRHPLHEAKWIQDLPREAEVVTRQEDYGHLQRKLPPGPPSTKSSSTPVLAARLSDHVYYKSSQAPSPYWMHGTLDGELPNIFKDLDGGGQSLPLTSPTVPPDPKIPTDSFGLPQISSTSQPLKSSPPLSCDATVGSPQLPTMPQHGFEVEPQDTNKAQQPSLVGNRNILAKSFACIAMFESGDFDIDPLSISGVMALSIGDSIYVTSELLSDPSEATCDRPVVRRVMGNLGRPEMAFLTPPSQPKLKGYDLKSWNQINHVPFKGVFEDNFPATSLHLSFTDFEMPVDIGVRGLRDTLVVLIESLISINDKGKHLGDLDIMNLSGSEYLTFAQHCSHTSETNTWPKGLTSIDSWAEFFDLPKTTGIVRAYGNWEARLALTTASIQQRKRTLLLSQKPCLACLMDYNNLQQFDIVIA